MFAPVSGAATAAETPTDKPPSGDSASTLEVQIMGVQGPMLENIKAHLEIYRIAGKPPPSRPRLRWLNRRATRNIEQALEPFGYYHATVDSTLEETGTGWKATYRVDPGPPLPVSAIDIQILGEGREDPAFVAALDSSGIAVGQPLNHARYEALKNKLTKLAAERGYFDAKYQVRQIRINAKANRARIVLYFDTGRRYYFGDIVIQQSILAPDFVQRFVHIKAGQPYQASKLIELQNDLLGSDYFDQVEVDAPPAKADAERRIPITVITEPRKAREYMFGVGYGTDTGPRGAIGLEGRRANRWGHIYRMALRVSAIRSQAAADYIIPVGDPSTDSFALQADYTNEDSDSRNYESITFSGKWTRERGLWRHSLSLNFGSETYRTGDDVNTSFLLVPAIQLTRTKTDHPLNVHKGTRLNLTVRGSSDVLISDVSFLQGLVQAKGIWPVGEKGRLSLRGELGTTWTNDFDALPTSLRFFTGGDNTVRGYDYESISPTNSQGDLIGGRHLVTASVEYDYEVRENWRVAAFVDTGDAFNDNLDLNWGVGVGFIWQSPVGPFRLDVASGLERPPGSVIRLHFNVGPEL